MNVFTAVEAHLKSGAIFLVCGTGFISFSIAYLATVMMRTNQ